MTGLATKRRDGVPKVSMKSVILDTLSKDPVKMVVLVSPLCCRLQSRRSITLSRLVALHVLCYNTHISIVSQPIPKEVSL